MLVVLLLGCLGFAQAADNKQNVGNLTCRFDAIATCYQNISQVGANFTAQYITTQKEVTDYCGSTNQNKTETISCLQRVEGKCSVKLDNNNIVSVEKHLTSICNQTSQYGKDFLNFTQCGNKILNERKQCVANNKAQNRSDNKSLCCEYFKTFNCIGDAAKKKCSAYDAKATEYAYKNFTVFQSTLCDSFKKQCSGSSQNYAVNFLTLTAIFLTLMSYTKA